MLYDKKDDVFLSRWITNELSPEELSAFKSHPEYDAYQKIKIATDRLNLRHYDEQSVLEHIKSNQFPATSKKSKPVVKLWPYAAVAASIAIVLGLFIFISNESSHHITDYGEQLVVTLPDGSEMILNAKSKASFDSENWDADRSVTLRGEAYFKVKKGSRFTVKTLNGEVSVLGTEFNVQSQDAFFEAVCYEGKVRVVSHNEETVLTGGKAYRYISEKLSEQWTFEETKPSWVDHSSSFKSVPLHYVFAELEEQYGIKVKRVGVDTNLIYTGTFPNDDLKVALKTVFSSLNMQYTLLEDGKTVVLKTN